MVTGSRGAGKSSPLNAISGGTIEHDGFAPTGAAEMTTALRRYDDPIHDGFSWYDTPGTGTVSVSAWGYCYNQRLFAYDEVILAHDTTLTQVCPSISAYLEIHC